MAAGNRLVGNEQFLKPILERSVQFNTNRIALPAGKTVLFSVQGKSTTAAGEKEMSLSYRVTNLWVGPDQPLVTTLPLTVSFPPTAAVR